MWVMNDMRNVTFKVDDNLLTLLDLYAMAHDLNRSEAIRRAIEGMVKGEVEKETALKARIMKGRRL